MKLIFGTNRRSICERQIAELTAYVHRAGFEIIAVVKETAIGTKNDRANRKLVLDLARKREIDLVLVSELSRWGRSTADLRNTIEDLATREVAIRALNGPDLDISTVVSKKITDWSNLHVIIAFRH